MTLGTLFLVATPIGNIDDISLRALRILANVGVVAAEDTRTARHLLQHHNIRARLLSYTEHNRRIRIPQILSLLAADDVALVSEAGMPAISDPGQELVVAAAAAGYAVQAVPGPSAILAALTISGLSTRQFTYLGFLPRQAGARRSLMREIAQEPRTIVCFESPHRLVSTLRDLLETLGDRRIAVCRELTKLHEETLRLRISDAIASITEPRGEYTLVVEGAEAVAVPALSPSASKALRDAWQQGMSAREAIARIAPEHHLPRRLLYEEWLAIGNRDDARPNT